jgi:diketogulonate reductase-like aldo/keto reductase
MQNNVVSVTTTSKPERLDEYAHALKIKLSPEELKEIKDVGATHHFRTSWGEHFEDDDRSYVWQLTSRDIQKKESQV